MNYPIDLNKIPSGIEFYAEVVEMNEKAKAYLLGFFWCPKILGSKIYLNIGSKLAIFLIEIENTASLEDNYLWVIVGDIPSMYLNVQKGDTVKLILEDYISLASDWITQVQLGKSVEDCYPFNAEPTAELAEMLKRRVDFIKNTVMDNIDDLALT